MSSFFGKTEYRVLRKLKSLGGTSYYSALDGELPVLIIKTAACRAARDTESFFMEPEAQDFTDLVEVFRDGNEPCLVLNYIQPDAILLEKHTADLCLRERSRLAMSLLREIRGRGIPWPVLSDVLHPDRIYAAPDGQISFLYLLTPREDYRRDCRASAMELLAEVLGLIFGGADYPAIGLFLDELQGARFASIDEVCAGLSRVCSAIENMPAEEPPERGLKDKLLELIGKLRDIILPNLAAIIAAALLIFGYVKLGQALYGAIVNVPISGNLTSIGTVELYEEAE